MKTIVITQIPPENISELITITEDDFVIVVDGALASVLKQKIKIDLVIGDFDSLQTKSLLRGLEYIKLNPKKDRTDTFVAVKYAYENTNNEVFLIGGIQGERIEHFIANLLMLNHFPNLTIIDENSTLYLLDKGKHLISKEYYISFFGYREAIITLEGFKYPLNKYHLKQYDPLCISNEIVKTYGEIIIDEGRVVVIKTKKRPN